MILDSNSDSELFCSLHVPQAATFNKEGLLEEAQKYHKRAYGCNLCSAATIATYGGIILVGIIVGVYYGVALISVQ